MDEQLKNLKISRGLHHRLKVWAAETRQQIGLAAEALLDEALTRRMAQGAAIPPPPTRVVNPSDDE